MYTNTRRRIYKLTYSKMTDRAFGGMHSTDRYAAIPYDVQAERLLALGCDGIKLMDQDPILYLINGCGVDDRRYDRMFSLRSDSGRRDVR